MYQSIINSDYDDSMKAKRYYTDICIIEVDTFYALFEQLYIIWGILCDDCLTIEVNYCDENF